MIREFHQRAIEMRIDFRTTSELHVRADIVSALFAEGASAARDADFESDAVADLETRYVWSEGYDSTGGLVAQTHRLADDEVTIAAVVVVVEV